MESMSGPHSNSFQNQFALRTKPTCGPQFGDHQYKNILQNSKFPVRLSPIFIKFLLIIPAAPASAAPSSATAASDPWRPDCGWSQSRTSSSAAGGAWRRSASAWLAKTTLGLDWNPDLGTLCSNLQNEGENGEKENHYYGAHSRRMTRVYVSGSRLWWYW